MNKPSQFKFKTDKDKQIVLETYGSGPWRMVNIIEWQKSSVD